MGCFRTSNKDAVWYRCSALEAATVDENKESGDAAALKVQVDALKKQAAALTDELTAAKKAPPPKSGACSLM